MNIYAGMVNYLARNIGDRAALPDSLFGAPTMEQLAKHENTEARLAFKPDQALPHYLQGSGLTVAHQPLQITLLAEKDVGKPFSELPLDITGDREIGKRARDGLLAAGGSLLGGLARPDGKSRAAFEHR